LNNRQIGHDFVITGIRPWGEGPTCWVSGFIHQHSFCAKVYPLHAANPDWEIGDSRISKLELCNLASERPVYVWDRGLCSRPPSPLVRAIVDFLAANLSERLMGKAPPRPEVPSKGR
jgi:hypothetical protein